VKPRVWLRCLITVIINFRAECVMKILIRYSQTRFELLIRFLYILYVYLFISVCFTLGGFLVSTAWRVLELRMEENASSLGLGVGLTSNRKK
jgi:hypothetical protein